MLTIIIVIIKVISFFSPLSLSPPPAPPGVSTGISTTKCINLNMKPLIEPSMSLKTFITELLHSQLLLKCLSFSPNSKLINTAHIQSIVPSLSVVPRKRERCCINTGYKRHCNDNKKVVIKF